MSVSVEVDRMVRGRCVHGLRAGLCNACPAHRRDDNQWVWDAVRERRNGRVSLIGGRRFMLNRHGVALRECGFSRDGWRGVSFDWDDDTTKAVGLAFEDADMHASCSPGRGGCACAPRF